jgi:FAD/FMN-containing dehydrogenase
MNHSALMTRSVYNMTRILLPGDVSVDCDDMPASLDNIMVHLFGPGNSFNGNVFSSVDGLDYEEASHQYATARVTTAPSYIVEAMNSADVQAAVLFASACDRKVTTRSGGHSYVGSSSCDGGVTSCIQLDVSNLDTINVVSDSQIKVGPGVRLFDLYPVLIANDIFLPAGEFPL